MKLRLRRCEILVTIGLEHHQNFMELKQSYNRAGLFCSQIQLRRVFMRKLRHLLRILILYATILLILNYLKILINSPFVQRVAA